MARCGVVTGAGEARVGRREDVGRVLYEYLVVDSQLQAVIRVELLLELGPTLGHELRDEGILLRKAGVQIHIDAGGRSGLPWLRRIAGRLGVLVRCGTSRYGE